jgi:purine-binding chemotaxis protein CheW
LGAKVTLAQPELLVFEVGGQRYGLPAADVRELFRAVTLTPLPRAPAIVEGVINVRGELVPVLDIRGRFRLPAKPPEPSDHLIVARAGDRLVALRVDRAVELTRLEPAALERAEAVVPGVAYVAQMAKLPDGLLLVHDLKTFLSHAEASELAEALAPGGPPLTEGRTP